jgi:hypothetical protein
MRMDTTCIVLVGCHDNILRLLLPSVVIFERAACFMEHNRYMESRF